MQNIAIDVLTPPAFPASLRSAESGDSGGTATWEAQTEDIADALGHLKATKANLASPALTGNATAVNLAVGGTLGVTGATTLGATDINGVTTLDGATTAADFTMSGTNKVKLASRSIVRVQPFAPYSLTSTWVIVDDGTAYQNVDNGTDLLIIPIRPPHGTTLTAVTVYIKGAVGHAGAPSTTPQLRLQYVTNAGGSSTVGSASDPYTSSGVYQGVHPLSVSGLGHVVDRVNNRYQLRLSGEASTNYVVGLLYYSATCTYTTTSMDED